MRSFLNQVLSTIPFSGSKQKIFGVGMLKTGTTSLGAALEVLGFKHTHGRRGYLLEQVQQGNLDPVFRWANQYDSFEDWPWPLIYKELDARYRNSVFILTTRASEEVWINSMKGHAQEYGPSSGREFFFGHGMPHGHEAEYIECYNQHNQQVHDYFSDRPGKLLEVCWETGDGWPELCEFLGLPIPNLDFPKVNTSKNRVKKTNQAKA